MKFEELNVYKLSMEIGEKIWSIIIKWDYFSRDFAICIGRKQLIRAIDSVSVKVNSRVKISLLH